MLPAGFTGAMDLSFSNLLWVGAALGQLAALLSLLRYKLVREFPVFFTFLSFHVLLTVLLWWFRPYFAVPFSRYFYTYWIGQAVDTGVEILDILLSPVKFRESRGRKGKLSGTLLLASDCAAAAARQGHSASAAARRAGAEARPGRLAESAAAALEAVGPVEKPCS